MLVVMRMFLEPIRDGLMRTLETAGVDGVAVGTRRVSVKHQVVNPVSEAEHVPSEGGQISLTDYWQLTGTAFQV